MTQTANAPAKNAPAKSKMATVRELLLRSKGQIEMALPKHMSADRMTRVAVTSCQKNPELLGCHPVTLIGAIIQSAQLGLEPDTGIGEAYLVPFWNSKKNRREVQFIPGYRGLMKLARQSNEITKITAAVVHAKDKFDYSKGTEEFLTHKPSEETDPGPVTHFYAVAKYRESGEAQFEVMTKAQVDEIRKRAKSKSGPWSTDYEEMGKKTVVRRLCKYLPTSTELSRAVTLDEEAEAGVPQDLGILGDPEEEGSRGTEPIKKPEATGPASTGSEKDGGPKGQAEGKVRAKVTRVAKTTVEVEGREVEGFVVTDDQKRKYHTDSVEVKDAALAAKEKGEAVTLHFIADDKDRILTGVSA